MQPHCHHHRQCCWCRHCDGCLCFQKFSHLIKAQHIVAIYHKLGDNSYIYLCSIIWCYINSVWNMSLTLCCARYITIRMGNDLLSKSGCLNVRVKQRRKKSNRARERRRKWQTVCVMVYLVWLCLPPTAHHRCHRHRHRCVTLIS